MEYEPAALRLHPRIERCRRTPLRSKSWTTFPGPSDLQRDRREVVLDDVARGVLDRHLGLRRDRGSHRAAGRGAEPVELAGEPTPEGEPGDDGSEITVVTSVL